MVLLIKAMINKLENNTTSTNKCVMLKIIEYYFDNLININRKFYLKLNCQNFT